VSDRTSKHDYMFPLFNILNNNVSQFNIMWYHKANVFQCHL
jgi:hypothetical protein